jgi:hypothetical protein
VKALIAATVVVLAGCAVLESREAVVFCQAADTVTTFHALDLGAREANPFVDRLLTNLGPGGFIAAKIAVTLAVLHYYPDLSSDLVIVINAATCAVAAHNAYVASQLERQPSARFSE